MGQARLGWLVCAGLSLLLLGAPGCVEPPGATRIIGPDGTGMLHVHCPGEQVACFQIAGDRCPHGYDLSPIFNPRDGNFLVRCRELQSSPVVVASAASARPNAQAAAIESWPPSAEVATPSEPWPAHASTELPPAPRTASGVVDLGY